MKRRAFVAAAGLALGTLPAETTVRAESRQAPAGTNPPMRMRLGCQSGPADAFQETYPHDGDVDMLRAMRVYREVGYPYLVMPDHVPSHEDDPGGTQAFAFCYGRPSPRAHFS